MTSDEIATPLGGMLSVIGLFFRWILINVDSVIFENQLKITITLLLEH